MISCFDPGALLGASYRLPGGARVRLRIVAPSDRPRILALLRASGVPDHEIAAGRLLRFDPHREAVVCATMLIDGAAETVGVGAIELNRDRRPATDPQLLVVHPAAPAGLRDLLAGAIVGRAHALARTRAASPAVRTAA
jgi:hypothetical protein